MDGITKEELMELFVTDVPAKKAKKKREMTDEQRESMLERLRLMREKAAEKRGKKPAEAPPAPAPTNTFVEPPTPAPSPVVVEAVPIKTGQSYDKSVHEKILNQLSELNQHTRTLAEYKKAKQPKASLKEDPPAPKEEPKVEAPPPVQLHPQPIQLHPQPITIARPPVEPKVEYIMPNRAMIKRRGL